MEQTDYPAMKPLHKRLVPGSRGAWDKQDIIGTSTILYSELEAILGQEQYSLRSKSTGQSFICERARFLV